MAEEATALSKQQRGTNNKYKQNDITENRHTF